MPALPMWPAIALAGAQPAPSATTTPRERWIIVDGSVRREVSERDFRGALGTCARIEVARYPHDDAVTHICYR